MAIDISRAQFEELVNDALDQIPDELFELMVNVVIEVEDTAPDGDPHLLGLYEGIPLTERDSSYSMVLPDRIRIFREPILGICDTLWQVIDEVHVTVVHEIAHHFGISDARLHELGYA